MSKNDVVTHQALIDVASTTTKELQVQLHRKRLLRNEFREHIGRGKEGTAEMKDRVEKYKKSKGTDVVGADDDSSAGDDFYHDSQETLIESIVQCDDYIGTLKSRNNQHNKMVDSSRDLTNKH
jgi:hypothetical protein